VRVKVATGLSVDQTDDIAVAREPERLIWLVGDFVAVRVKEPVVIGVLVVVAGDLLLSRTLGVRLNVRVQQSTTISHVLQCCTRAIRNLQRAVLANLRSPQICLEERAHLGVTGSAIFEDDEVQVEREHVNGERDEDQTEHSESKVHGELDLDLSACFYSK
jgi:hypothetical protein